MKPGGPPRREVGVRAHRPGTWDERLIARLIGAGDHVVRLPHESNPRGLIMQRTDAEQLVVNVNHTAAIAWAANALKALQVNAPELTAHAQRMVEALIAELDHEHLSFSSATVVLRDSLSAKGREVRGAPPTPAKSAAAVAPVAAQDAAGWVSSSDPHAFVPRPYTVKDQLSCRICAGPEGATIHTTRSAQ